MNEESDITAQREIESLRRRVAELEQALSASERREQELRDVEARYRVVLDWSDNGMWEWNLVSQMAHMSPGWFRLLGYEPDEIPNNAITWLNMIHPEDVPRTSDAFKAHLEGRTSVYEVENRMVHKSGKTLWIRTRGKVHEHDAEGRPVRMIGTTTDVTRQKEAEDELRRSQSVLFSVIDYSPAAIMVRDLEYRLMLLNKEAEALLGLDRRDVVGKHDYEIYRQDIVKAARVIDTMIVEKGEPISMEGVALKNGEPRSYLHLKFPIRDERGKLVGIGGLSTDITLRKRAEEERLAMQERIIEAQRSALRELSTPLLPIGSDVVVIPLIGTIDSQRAQQLMETLLGGVVEHRAATVILDVTGVLVIDTQVANALVQASKAVRLLGAEVVLTGLRPEVARTLVSMGADLGAIVTHGSLRSGIAYALARAGDAD